MLPSCPRGMRLRKCRLWRWGSPRNVPGGRRSGTSSPAATSSRMGDRQVVEIQIGRTLRSNADVVVRCHLGVPVVIRVPPLLDDGTPFPTLYWLSCPLAVKRIGRIESAGGVASMDRKAMRDPRFGAALETAHVEYAAERTALLAPGTDPAPSGGVAGARVGGKCLHAHYA